MSISQNFVNLRPSLLLDFANTEQLDPRVSFSRPTTAAYYDANTTALAEQNLFTNSQNIVAGPWNPGGVTFTANSTTAPDGTTTASSGIPTTSINGKTLTQTNVGSITGTYTVSFFVKANGYSAVILTNGAQTNRALFDLSAVTNTNTGSVTSTITASTNGFYRITMTITLSNENVYLFIGNSLSNYAGDGTSGIYIWGAQLEQRSSVTAYNATTTTAITNYIPVLQTAPTNQARFDHDPVARTSLGLLIEQQSTNLFTYSSDYTQSAWTKVISSVTPTSNIAPDGTQTAIKFVPDSTTGFHLLQQAITVTAIPYTFSAYMKAGESGYGVLSFNPLGQVVINLSTGATSQNVNATTVTTTSVGNGWWRIQVTFTPSAGTTNCQLAITPNSTWSSWTGNAFNGGYIWGAQLEALAFPTSYIPTVASQVTRSADTPLNSGVNFSSWFNSQQGTVYCSFDTPTISSSASAMAVWAIDNGTNAQYYVNKSTATLTAYEGSANASMGTITANTTQQSVYTFNNISSVSASGLINGGSVGTITATPQSNIPTQLTLGRYATSSNPFTGHIRKLAFYPVSSTTAQMQSLTGS